MRIKSRNFFEILRDLSRSFLIPLWMFEDYRDYVVSVDQIEAWTGFDLFTNLPGDNSSGIEKTAEANTSWTSFQNF